MASSTPWALLDVEGDDNVSDGDDDVAQSTESLDSALLSPASKRARKRQTAARNKRAKLEAAAAATAPKSVPQEQQKNGKNGSVAAAASAVASSAKSLVNGQASASSTTSASKQPNGASTAAPPTFVDSKAAAPASAGKSYGDPFLQPASSSTLNGASTSAPPPPTFTDDGASVATETDYEDVSLLADEDSESSYASEDEDEVQQGTAAGSLEPNGAGSNVLEEPATPRPNQVQNPKAASIQTANAANTVRSAAHDALQSITQSSAVPASVQDVAEKAKNSDLLRVQDASAAQPYGSDHDPNKKLKAIITRTIWTLVMIAGFVGLMMMGHVYLIIMVMFCQAAVFKEISALFDVAAKPLHHHGHHPSRSIDKAISPNRAARDARARAERDRWSKVLSWYFFAATNYFLHGETIIYYFKHIVFVDAYFIPFARHHRFISFMLYTLGFVGFVTNLKRNQLRRQFGLFCWIHMSLLLIVVSSHFIVNNILEGIIWFWLPASLVVMNDIAAYVWGMLFGRTQLIKLSPKKTVEGFVGAAFTTVVFAYGWATLFMRYSYMICPAIDLGTTAFSSVECSPNDVFAWRYLDLPIEISAILSLVYPVSQIPWAPFQLHALVMGVFASLVAPFGGFFASGFKRAFNVKDFGDSIPGHGGMTDRMDCQFLMGLFAYVYYSSIIRDNHVTVGAVMQTIVSSLGPQEQAELAKALAGYLAQQGIQWK